MKLSALQCSPLPTASNPPVSELWQIPSFIKNRPLPCADSAPFAQARLPFVQPIVGELCGGRTSCSINVLAVQVPPPQELGQKMAAAAELRLLEKSLGLKPGNKYSAQGERQVRRSGRKASGRRGDPELTRPSRDTRVDSTPHVHAGRAAWLGLDL